MRNFLATVLSVIALGVMLIAYGLLSPRAAATDLYPQARPIYANGRVVGIEDLTPRRAMAYPVSDLRAAPAYDDIDRVQADDLRRARALPARRLTTRSAPARVVRASGRDWAKTAMVIGGTGAAGAGLGAIFGGKRGALIGAAIGGGAGTLFELKGR
jgi:hypothetical protein